MDLHIDERIWQRELANGTLKLPALSSDVQKRAFRLALLFSDGLMLVFALLLAYWVRFELEIALATDIVPETRLYMGLMVMLVPLWLALFGVTRLYDFRYLLGGTEEYARVFNACSIGVLVVPLMSFLEPSLLIARGWLVYAWLFSFLLVAGARFLLRRVVYWLRQHGYFVVPAAIVGVNEEAVALADQLASWSTSGLLIRGFVDTGVARTGQHEASTSTNGIVVLGDLNNLPSVVARHDIEELIVATSAVSADHLLELYRRFGSAKNISLRLSSGIFDAFTTGLYVKELGFVPLISVNKVRLSPQEAFVKRCFDIFGSIVGLILLSPLLACIAIAVKRDSPGPVIYRRRVLGQRGKVFDAFKFRSMFVDGDNRLTPEEWAELQTSHKLRDDPRITRVGQVIRKYSLDELPQLVNVLIGQMSLIGPRMITPAEQAKYGKWDMNLLTVKPGISGLWQVSGRSDVSYEERVNLDMQYIRNYSVWLDIHLFLRTIAAVVKGEGAY